MATNGVNMSEDAEMADCDGEKVVTMMDVLREQQDFEDDANAVLGASDDKNCTYSKGYVKRQAIYACLTCCPDAVADPTKRAGVCLACSLSCHENHELIELYTKRNFRCDCGNPKFTQPCQFTPNKMDLNYENKYNQNFSGLYCNCKRPYPDPDNTDEEEMIQCIVCEDWLHTNHLEATVPNSDQYSEMICKVCMEDIDFLHDYSDLVVNVEDKEIIVMDPDLEVTNADKAKEIAKKDQLSNGIADAIVDEEKDEAVSNSIESENKKYEESTDIEMNENKPDESGDAKQVSIEGSSVAEKDEQNITDETTPDSATNPSNADQETGNDKKEETPEPVPDKESDEKVNEDNAEGKEQVTESVKESTESVKEQSLDSANSQNIEAEKIDNISDENKETSEVSTDKAESSETSTNETENSEISTDKTENSESTEKEAASTNADSATKTVKDDSVTTTTESVSSSDVDKPQEEDMKEDNSNAIPEKETELPTNNPENKRRHSEDDNVVSPKKQKLETKPCVRPRGVKRVYKGATFWPSTLRQKLCTCSECLAMYKDLAVLFLTDPEDTVTAYEALGKENVDGAPSSQYEKGLQALSSLDRVHQINALTEYNKMRDKLLDFLKSFKDRKEIVKEEDIKAFFAGMKPKREPDGVYFCR